MKDMITRKMRSDKAASNTTETLLSLAQFVACNLHSDWTVQVLQDI